MSARTVRRVVPLFALIVLALVGTSAGASPAAGRAADPKPTPWRADQWPQTQPWQKDGPKGSPTQRRMAQELRAAGFPAPIDPQDWENPDEMTWEDYTKPPGTTWNDPSVQGSKDTFKGALVLLDYPNQPFVVTQPQGSTVFGNPSSVASNVPRSQVAQFYEDFLNKPGALNGGRTIHEYWMEDSGGRYGVDLTAFGPYTMPGKDHEYGLEFQGQEACPAGDTCTRNIRTDGLALWQGAEGAAIREQFDFVFILSAGQDESSTWQEFGMMKFPTKEDVTDPFGPPDSALPNWSDTRYVDWTSWASGSTIWPNAGGGSSTQAESSGMGVYAHELSHILGIGDNYNNPYGIPPRRSYSGIWDMLSRGSFNGPGGPHSRWVIPATGGGSLGAQHMLRNKMKLEMVDEANVLRLSREALADSGLAVATVTARAVEPGDAGLSGINVELENGDRSPACSTATNPLCDGGGYDNYTVEVVDRMGADSFTPDSGVLLAKTKNANRSPFAWVIDANPQDIGMTDYVLPDGTKVPITIGDYRQLSDALFKAGAKSGSQYEYVDEANRLHFYVLDLKRDAQGVLTYTVAVRSLDGSGDQQRGVALQGRAAPKGSDGLSTCRFRLTNTGSGVGDSSGQPEDVTPYLDSDVYRLSASTSTAGWRVNLPNELATAQAGESVEVPVQALAADGTKRPAKVTLTATSESDPSKTATATCTAIAR